MAIGLVVIICASLAYSIADTHNNPTAAFFSPLTRAWELALGALVAIATPWLLKLPERLAAIATWLGVGAVTFAAVVFTSQDAYPGSLVIIPVVGAALIIAGGTRAPAFGAEIFLRLSPVRWIGKLSYSLYLWHWPILIVAAEYAGKTTLSVKDNLGWDFVALLASVVTYFLIEKPIRHAAYLRASRWASVGLGVLLVVVTLGAITVLSNHSISSGAAVGRGESQTAASVQGVLRAVAKSDQIRVLPSNLKPSLSGVLSDPRRYIGYPPEKSGCVLGIPQTSVPSCTFGDVKASHTMVLYGDSHAGMWFRVMNQIAKSEHWKLVILFKDGCPASDLPTPQPSTRTGDWPACDQWHRFAINRIKRINPALLIVSQTAKYGQPQAGHYTPTQWNLGLQRLLATLKVPRTTQVVLGIPAVPQYDGLQCLSSSRRQHPSVFRPTGPRLHAIQ